MFSDTKRSIFFFIFFLNGNVVNKSINIKMLKISTWKNQKMIKIVSIIQAVCGDREVVDSTMLYKKNIKTENGKHENNKQKMKNNIYNVF